MRRTIRLQPGAAALVISHRMKVLQRKWTPIWLFAVDSTFIGGGMVRAELHLDWLFANCETSS